MEIVKVILRKYYMVLIAAVSLVFTFHYHDSEGFQGKIWSDAEGYYIYLPAVFIYGGFDDIPVRNCCGTNEDGRITTKYTSGVAILELPFFLAVHGFVELSGIESNGMSGPYSLVLVFSAFFYLLMGALLLRNFLTVYFSKEVAAVSVILVCLATNLFHYSLRESGMSHVYSFFLFSAFLVLLHKVLREPTTKWFALLGAVFGLICLIRPTNVILGLFVLFYDSRSLSDVRERLSYFWRHRNKMWLIVPILFIIALPQMIYWKHIYGDFITYSYGDLGSIRTGSKTEGFIFWNQPKIGQVLFSHQNGLFMYTPLALFAVAGSIWLSIRNKLNGRLILIIFLLATYIFASWWAWWFGGAFGHRCFVEYYSILSIPLAFLISRVYEDSRNRFLQIFTLLLCLLLIYINIRMTYLYAPPWDGDGWTWARYINVWKNVFYLGE